MKSTLLMGAALLLTIATVTRDASAATGPNVVYEWNQLLQSTIPGAGGVGAVRFYSLTHIAMFDAVNAIERRYSPFRVHPRWAGTGSTEAAAAQAAHDVLVALNPASTALYDAALAAQLGPNPNTFVKRGAEIGAAVAADILAWRQNDGWVVATPPAYAEPPLPGRWQPTPPANAAAAFTQLANAATLALLTPTQFLPPPPPALTSDRYATDLNEIKAIGKSDSATRTPEQTEIARLWASVAASGSGAATHNFAIWNNITRDASMQRGLSLVATARLFALVNVSVHDALHTTMASKFVYGFWRPVTAIRQADTDLNPATDSDPTWLPLIATPPYPSYAGNMATIGASAARALQLALGTDNMNISATWKQSGGQPDVVRQFTTFTQVADEQLMARIYGGIHYRFDQEAGQQIGRKTAEFVAANFMTRPGL
jgi:hypothetical protein